MISDRKKPFFLITIDTEGDDLWSGGRKISTRNAGFLPRFQELCEAYSLKPTWLVDFEMSESREFIEFGSDILRRKSGEIGMHLHAWNTPPDLSVTEDDYTNQPYLTEYSIDVMKEKIDIMTSLLEDTFQAAITSHRAGRWGFDARYARILSERGYLVDCSVTPHVSWRRYRGVPGGRGGPDYRGFPDRAYFLDQYDISREGNLPLLEIPVSILKRGGWTRSCLARATNRIPLAERVLNRLSRPVSWLRPNGSNRSEMARILVRVLDTKQDYAEFILHSSELMPGGSPRFRTEESIEALYRDIEFLFETAKGRFTGKTLTGFHDWFTTGA